MELNQPMKVIDKLGSWGSSAIDDPNCCEELKEVYRELLEVVETSLKEDKTAYRTCVDCSYCDYDNGDSDVGMAGFIYCGRDEDGMLDLENVNYAPGCPLFYPKEN